MFAMYRWQIWTVAIIDNNFALFLQTKDIKSKEEEAHDNPVMLTKVVAYKQEPSV